jgi:hypothetical protein
MQARCFICLSDANAALSMTSGEYFHFNIFLDSHRQEYIWIDDFTLNEANDYFDKVGFPSDKEIREKIFKNLGTKPVALNDLVNSTLKPDEFIENQIEEDKDKVKRCVQDDEKTLKLFEGIVRDEYNNGMNEGIAMDIMKLSTEKIADGPAVKGQHVLAYDIEKRMFKFHSNSMREATRRFIEINKK